MKIDIGLHPRYEVVEINYTHELEKLLTQIITNDMGQNDPFLIVEYLFRYASELLLDGEIDVSVHSMDDVARWVKVVK